MSKLIHVYIISLLFISFSFIHAQENIVLDPKQDPSQQGSEEILVNYNEVLSSKLLGSIAFVNGGCLGTVVAPRVILTIAHCVVDSNARILNGLQSVWVKGQNLGVEKVFVKKGFNQNVKNNWAFILLEDNNVSNSLNTMVAASIGFNDPSHQFPDYVQAVGYNPSRGYTHQKFCSIYKDKNSLLQTSCLKTTGTSGSPLLISDNETGNVVVAMLSYHKDPNGGSVIRYVVEVDQDSFSSFEKLYDNTTENDESSSFIKIVLKQPIQENNPVSTPGEKRSILEKNDQEQIVDNGDNNDILKGVLDDAGSGSDNGANAFTQEEPIEIVPPGKVVNAEEVPLPDVSEEVVLPDAGEEVPLPDVGEEVVLPDAGEEVIIDQNVEEGVIVDTPSNEIIPENRGTFLEPPEWQPTRDEDIKWVPVPADEGRTNIQGTPRILPGRPLSSSEESAPQLRNYSDEEIWGQPQGETTYPSEIVDDRGTIHSETIPLNQGSSNEIYSQQPVGSYTDTYHYWLGVIDNMIQKNVTAIPHLEQASKQIYKGNYESSLVGRNLDNNIDLLRNFWMQQANQKQPLMRQVFYVKGVLQGYINCLGDRVRCSRLDDLLARFVYSFERAHILFSNMLKGFTPPDVFGRKEFLTMRMVEFKKSLVTALMIFKTLYVEEYFNAQNSPRYFLYSDSMISTIINSLAIMDQNVFSNLYVDPTIYWNRPYTTR